MKRLLNYIIVCAIVASSVTVFADEFADSADISYSYDEKYDQTQEEDDKISSKYDSYGEDYDPEYDESISQDQYYEEQRYEQENYYKDNTDSAGDYIPDYYNDDTDVIKVFVNNRQVDFDVMPLVVNERTMVPLRAIFEALGADVTWEASSNAVIANYAYTQIILHIADSIMLVNGEERYLDSPPFIMEERTLVPVRAIAEAFDCVVEWDGKSKTVNVYSSPIETNRKNDGGYIENVELPEAYYPNGVLVNGNQLCFACDDGLDMDGIYPLTITVYTANNNDEIINAKEFIIFDEGFNAAEYCTELNDFSLGRNGFGMIDEWASYYYNNNILIEEYTTTYLKEELGLYTFQDVINMYEEYGWEIVYK